MLRIPVTCCVTALLCTAASVFAAAPSTKPASNLTLVTLHVKDAPIKDVLADLSKQAQTPIALATVPTTQPRADAPIPDITLDADNQPFWPTLLKLCDQAGLTARPTRTSFGGGAAFTTSTTITLIRRDPDAPVAPFVVSKDLVFQPAPLSILPRWGLEPQRPGFMLQMFIDPKIHVLAIRPAAEVLDISDPAGNDLLWPASDDDAFGGLESDWCASFRVTHILPPENTTRLSRFRTAVRVIVGECDEWQIETPLAALPATGSNSVGVFTIDSLTRDGNYYSLLATLEAPPSKIPTGQPPRFTSPFERTVTLLDANGHILRSTSSGIPYGADYASDKSPTTLVKFKFAFPASTPSAPGRFGNPAPGGRAAGADRLVYVGRGGGAGMGPGASSGGVMMRPDPVPFDAPVKLLWSIPLHTREISVPVDFDNLPLP